MHDRTNIIIGPPLCGSHGSHRREDFVWRFRDIMRYLDTVGVNMKKIDNGSEHHQKFLDSCAFIFHVSLSVISCYFICLRCQGLLLIPPSICKKTGGPIQEDTIRYIKLQAGPQRQRSTIHFPSTCRANGLQRSDDGFLGVAGNSASERLTSFVQCT